MKTQILGMQSREVEDQAQRVKDFMNYQITEVMEEFDQDTDQMLFYLPITGSTFKKVFLIRHGSGLCLSLFLLKI